MISHLKMYNFSSERKILLLQQYQFVMQLNNSTIQPKRGHQTDKYQGGIHPTTKLRHGQGSYTYNNSFFTYEGQYENGRKQGKGALKFKDGRVIIGTFVDDQLIGPATIHYSDGSKYVGNLQLGQRSGHGVFSSIYESYDGEWKDNNRNGHGTNKKQSNNEEFVGQYVNDKPEGRGLLKKWNYQYEGQFKNGLKEGEGKEINEWRRQQNELKKYGRYQYNGGFYKDKFAGEGEYKSKQSAYVYKGKFKEGFPILYPNEFRLFYSMNIKNGQEVTESQKLLLQNQSIQYQLEGDSFNLYIDTIYQGPQVLDEIQPTQEQIDNLVKNWQNENKKNKNPPPMPDFNQPRMKKPDAIIVSQETGRSVQLRLIKQVQGKDQFLKIDYRSQIIAKRKENEQIKLENMKKAEEDGNKKGGKKDNKGEPELKVNLYKEKPSKKQITLAIRTNQGQSLVQRLQFPDDFPVGKYFIQIRSPFVDFGQIKSIRKQINIKTKVVKKK